MPSFLCSYLLLQNIHFTEQRRREKAQSEEREIKKSKLTSYKEEEDDRCIEGSPRHSKSKKKHKDRDKERYCSNFSWLKCFHHL